MNKLQNTSRAVIESNFLALDQVFVSRQCSIIVHWVPSHCNINGNDVADEMAKAALSRPLIDIFPYPSCSYSKSKINQSIQSEYNQIVTWKTQRKMLDPWEKMGWL